MSLTIKFNRSDQVVKSVQTSVAQAIETSVDEIEQRLKDRLHESKSGEVYGEHQASAPGESPAFESGTTEGAIKAEPFGDTAQRVFVDGDEAGYVAKDLEYGTPGGRIAPRPWFWPTVDEQKLPHKAAISEAVKRGVS